MTDTAIESWLARVHGRVQGVGFREACVDEAEALGLTGWVRNRADGTVEALLQGRPERIARMRAWLGHGPPMAAVREVSLRPAPADTGRFDRFERRRSE
jgi:acylphosphatase